MTLELGVGQHTQDKLSFLNVVFLVSKLRRRVGKRDLPSQALYEGSGKQCRGPKFTHETAEHAYICFARTHSTGTRSHSPASKGVHSSMEVNARNGSYCCTQVKRTNKHEGT